MEKQKDTRTQAYARKASRTHMTLESKTLVSPHFQLEECKQKLKLKVKYHAGT